MRLMQLELIAIKVQFIFDSIRFPIKNGHKNPKSPQLQGLIRGLWAGGNSMRLHIGFKAPPPPLSAASKLKPGNKARKAISPLASSKDRKCVRGTGLLSQQRPVAIITSSSVSLWRSSSKGSLIPLGKTCDDRVRMRKPLFSRNSTAGQIRRL